MLQKNQREKVTFGNLLASSDDMLSRSLKRCCIAVGCCMFSLNVLAQSDQHITLHLTDASLEQVIWEIRQKTGLVFMYGTTDIQAVKGLTLHETNKPINEILDKCLKGTNLTYEISGKEIIIKQILPPPLSKKNHQRSCSRC